MRRWSQRNRCIWNTKARAYKFVYYLQTQGGRLTPLFQVTLSLPAGSIGMAKEEVTFVGVPMLSREAALAVARVFWVPEDTGTPPGAIALRGATNFQTPLGWDTVYTLIFNMIERPVAPMLVVRVETDWYAHETEFRYVLQAGEGISVSPTLPIGQVVFVPREEVTFRDCTPSEIEAIEASRQTFNEHKAAASQPTSYGLTYSPHYLRQSRAQRSRARTRAVRRASGRASSWPDPLLLVVPPPYAARVQVHAPKPPVDAAGVDPVGLAGKHGAACVGKRSVSVEERRQRL